jgi:hypothetical protein
MLMRTVFLAGFSKLRRLTWFLHVQNVSALQELQVVGIPGLQKEVRMFRSYI